MSDTIEISSRYLDNSEENTGSDKTSPSLCADKTSPLLCADKTSPSLCADKTSPSQCADTSPSLTDTAKSFPLRNTCPSIAVTVESILEKPTASEISTTSSTPLRFTSPIIMDMDDEDIHVAKTTLADIAEFSENTTQGREKLGSIQVFMLSENRDCNFF
jgi:hypothetical protein